MYQLWESGILVKWEQCYEEKSILNHKRSNAITASICKSLTVFTISPKAKPCSFMNRTWFGLLGEWPPLVLRDILPRLWSHCCNHPRSCTMGESLLPAHHALDNTSLILKAIHAGHPDFLPENITIANTCLCCGSCFLTAEEVIFNELQRCFLLMSEFMPSCPSNLLASPFVI